MNCENMELPDLYLDEMDLEYEFIDENIQSQVMQAQVMQVYVLQLINIYLSKPVLLSRIDPKRIESDEEIHSQFKEIQVVSEKILKYIYNSNNTNDNNNNIKNYFF